MTLYLDSSALVKLVQREPESEALRALLRAHPEDRRVASALVRAEVLLAVARSGGAPVAHARRALARVHEIDVTRAVLDDAAALIPGAALRTLDAIHLATALAVGPGVRVVTYDRRMAEAAATIGMAVLAPS